MLLFWLLWMLFVIVILVVIACIRYLRYVFYNPFTCKGFPLFPFRLFPLASPVHLTCTDTGICNININVNINMLTGYASIDHGCLFSLMGLLIIDDVSC